MMQTPPPSQLRTGEYIVNRGADTEAERADCKRVLRANGCKSVRFETSDREGNAPLVAHGYLAYVSGAEPT